MGFAIVCPLAQRRLPPIPVLVHRLAPLLHASFRPRLATTPLRFANPSPPSGWVEDFHLQAVEHARHTHPGTGPGPCPPHTGSLTDPFAGRLLRSVRTQHFVHEFGVFDHALGGGRRDHPFPQLLEIVLCEASRSSEGIDRRIGLPVQVEQKPLIHKRSRAEWAVTDQPLSRKHRRVQITFSQRTAQPGRVVDVKQAAQLPERVGMIIDVDVCIAVVVRVPANSLSHDED